MGGPAPELDEPAFEPPDESIDWSSDPGYDHPGLRYAPEEVRRLGEELFERDVMPAIARGRADGVVAIDVEGRGWEVADDPLAAGDALLRRVPDAQMWLRPVGGGSLYHFGGAGRRPARGQTP